MLLSALRDLFPFLAALYLLDGLAWVGALDLLFVRRLWGWTAAAGRGVRLAGVLPLDLAFSAGGPVAILTDEAVLVPEAAVRGGGIYDPERWRRLPYAGISPDLEDRTLRLGAGHQVRFPSPTHAEVFRERLDEIRRLPPGDREGRLGKKHDFDLQSARERLKVFREETQLLGVLGWGLFVLAFLLLPAVLYLHPRPDRLLKPLLWGILGLFLGTLWAFGSAGRSLRKRGLLRMSSASLGALILSPVSATRAVQALGRDLFAGFDPMTLTVLLLDRRRLLIRARAELHGAACASESGEGDWRRHWQRRRAWLLELFEQAGIPEAEVLANPDWLDAAAKSWCPVCGVESNEEGGACTDCGLPLVRASSGHEGSSFP